MELRHLRYFIAVAEELHFGRAAQRLHLSQPPLSKRIQELEGELGVQLFERNKRQVKLSEAGRAFLPEARKALAQLQAASESAQRAARGEVGLLRIAFVSSAAYTILPAVLRAYRTPFPRVELRLQELPTARQVADLQSGKIDAGFLRPPIEGRDLLVTTLLREPLMAALPKNHRLAGHGFLRVEDLAGEPFVLFPRMAGFHFYDRIVGLCRQAGFVPRVAQEAIQMQTIAGLVAGGLGVSIVPAQVSKLHLEGVFFRRLRGKEGPLEVEMALARRADNSSAVLGGFVRVAHNAFSIRSRPGKESRVESVVSAFPKARPPANSTAPR